MGDKPVILFSWTYNFDYYGYNHFPSSTYGNIIWDTHCYYGSKSNVNDALGEYDYDLSKI